MKKTMVKLVEPKVDTDKVKRVYRAAQDTIRRLDEIGKQKRAYRDVFMPEAIHLRSRLQDYCERLMLYGPLEYGRKAEELLWRKVYYDVIQLMKHNRKQMKLSNSLESAFRTHLAAAMGYYHHLLVRLQSEFHLALDGIVDFFHVPEPRSHQRLHQIRKTDPDMRVQDWATRACHRCLVYLGDLSRYQQDYDGMTSRVISQRCYHEALLLCPQIGMSHNQLGTLAGSRYYSLDAAYHYFRCLLCVESFDGAQGNLTRLLEKNRKRYQELSIKSPRDLPPAQQRAKDIKRFLVYFLNLLDVLLTAAPSVDAKALQDYCQMTLQQFNLCMLYLPPHVTSPAQSHDSQDERLLQYLEDDIVFKVVIICMMTVYQLQTTGNKRVTAAIAFSLALFSHVLNHVVMRLQATLCELENPSRLTHTDNPEVDELEDKEELEGERKDERREMKEEVNGEEGTKEPGRDRRSRTHRVRRRRRCVSDSLSESAGSGISSDESDLSERDRGLLGGSIMPSVGAVDSDDEVVNFANQSDSGSDSEDNLMVSQELWSGFSVQAFSTQMDAIEELSGHEMVSSPSSHSLGSGSQSPMLTLTNSSSDALNTVTQSNGELLDTGEYLKELPFDWLSDSNNLFRLPFSSNGAGDEHLDAVMQGQRDVRVPPGFERSEESLHVQEITKKITNFVIETDTDTSSFPTDTETSTVTESEMDTEVDTDHESVTDDEEMEQRRQERLVRVITSEGLLSSIKVYCDWMRCNTSIITTCAKSSQSLWSRLSVLLNFLPLEADLAKPELCGRSLLDMVTASTTGEWTQTQPLNEDIHLHKFPPLVDTHSSLLFDVHSRLDLSDTQEAILRVCCLRNFGYYMADVDEINLTFEKDKGMFYGPLPPQSEHEDKCTQQQMADAEVRRNQLMRDMAQLRLQTEVSQLEGSVQAADHPSLPPYLVPDAAVLCDSLSLLKQLAASARFIVIIPLVVIDQLDVLKKDSSGAREAIRWLEADFRKGNWYVRAQKNSEKTAALPLKNLKKKDKDAWRFLQIVDCCKYLAQQSGDCEPHGLVCILTPYKVTSTDISIRVKQAISTAQQDGIAVQTALEFHTKWKDVWKTSRG